MLRYMTKLSILALGLFLIETATAVATWPSPTYDELEDLMLLNDGYNARDFPFPVVPCTFARVPGFSIAGGFLRTAFHDMAAADIHTGIGGLDASIGFELDSTVYTENAGVAFNNSLTYYSKFFNDRASMSDLIGLGVYASVRACGGPVVPLRAGRIDATQAGAVGVPDPKDNRQKMAAQFARMGFNQQEMIQVVACGHTLGGVHSAQHPAIVPDGTTALGTGDFDATNSTYDNKVVTQYLDGSTKNTLCIGPDVDSRSDLRIFSSDGNKTVSAMADSASYSATCSGILQKMIDTVPAGVQLTDAVTPYDVKPYNLQLNVIGDESLLFSGEIRFRTNTVPKSTISGIQLHYLDRNGASAFKIDTVVLGDASGFDDTFTFFGFNATISAKTSISSFVVVATLTSSTVTYDNNGQGFPIQDTIFTQTLNSTLSPLDNSGNQKATIIAAVRSDTVSEPDMSIYIINPMTYNHLPTISKSTSTMTKICESKYYTFYSASYDVPVAAVNGTKYDVSIGSFSDSFKNLDLLPSTAGALICSASGSGGSGVANTTSTTLTWSNISTTSSSSSLSASTPANSSSSTQQTTSTSTQDSDIWTTTVVTAITTYCPRATSFIQNGKTYTATEATTLTIIDDCPCTISWTRTQPHSESSSSTTNGISNTTTTTSTTTTSVLSATTTRTTSSTTSDLPVRPMSEAITYATSSSSTTTTSAGLGSWSGSGGGVGVTSSPVSPAIATYTGSAGTLSSGRDLMMAWFGSAIVAAVYLL
ncbi:hypothetical protein H2202_001130 [Exophiala xenobiotica]|nr:hypothetical protein H2202_001130 [Exophiala xenobiotica]KAK5221026.1 hypothetical protein LTR72_006584 [Exophiala xenobiotica]KAK5234168.1 hypothetical protein LTR47_004759 [Exophiala xenobiotica]KAK5245028.1 hypothetical protein LTS06_009480 [Exophiala xenobiotica]KAK5282015.1 hypothetical protein LTR40_003920 [Exophiala xenobiotica]